MGSTFDETRENVREHIVAKGGLTGILNDMPKNMDIEASMENRRDHYKNTDMENMDMSAYVDCISGLVCIAASHHVSLDAVLGSAFSAKQETSEVQGVGVKAKERPMGGHCYPMATFDFPNKKNFATPINDNRQGSKSIITLEGTNLVVNMVMASSHEQNKSSMMNGKGLSDILTVSNNQSDGHPNIVFRTMMVSQNAKTPQDFYHLAHVAGTAMTYSEATEQITAGGVVGAYLFLQDTLTKQLSFGVFPELAAQSNVVRSGVQGKLGDTMISQKDSYKAMCTSMGSAAVSHNTSSPLTSSLLATVKGVREMGPQRVPSNDWKVNLPLLRPQASKTYPSLTTWKASETYPLLCYIADLDGQDLWSVTTPFENTG